jgi:hypothetical protein
MIDNVKQWIIQLEQKVKIFDFNLNLIGMSTKAPVSIQLSLEVN